MLSFPEEGGERDVEKPIEESQSSIPEPQPGELLMQIQYKNQTIFTSIGPTTVLLLQVLSSVEAGQEAHMDISVLQLRVFQV